MKDIDYENLFVYMSLIFAICIFIVLLYGCAFANPRGSGGSALLIENFEGESDIKTQVLTLLKELEDKSTTSSENKTKIKEIREKINNNNINVDELKTLIGLLKDMASSKDDDKKSSDSKDSKDNKDTKDSKSSDDSKDSKDSKS
jgi:TolA-binding protein